jgi:CRP-like cAMP-binding protein/Zn-dependent protease
VKRRRPSVYESIRRAQARAARDGEGGSGRPTEPDIWGRLAQAPPAAPGASVWDRLSAMVAPEEFRPKIADDIEIKEFRLRWGNDYAVIANPRDLIHYQLDPSEAELVKRMDGTRTVKEIVLDRLGHEGELEVSSVSDLVAQLHAGNFLDQSFVDVNEALGRAMHPISTPRRKLREFATTLSVEWKDAHQLVQWLYDHGLKWLFTRWATVLSVALAVTGVVAFVALIRSKQFDLTGESLVIGFVVLLVLDYFMVFVHELGHALVLVRNGRKVRSAGFQIYFGSPAFFVDASDGLMMERSQRIVESFAGPYAQMLVGGAASIVAWAFPGWILAETFYRYAVINYLVLTLNLIPLLELDGYWILSEVIQVPDLRPRSLSFVRHDLWHKLRTRQRFSKQDAGLGLYGTLGVAFTIFSFYTAFFYWRTIFGGLVSRLWNAGIFTRVLLLVLAVFVGGPVIRAAIKLVRSAIRRLRALWRRARFRLETRWRVEAAELIDALPLFDDLPVDVLNELAGGVRLRTFPPGQPVVRQGERAEAFYLVRSGTLRVIEEDPSSGTERVLRTLGRGESFGELGLAEGSPRSATVRTVEEAEVFEIDKGLFDRLLADTIHLPGFRPTIQAITELRKLRCFSHLEPDELAELLNHGAWVNIPPGETILEQGQPGDAFFAIGSGRVEVTENGRPLTTLGRGSYFGEVALLLDVPRTASVRAQTPVRAYRLDRQGFDRLIRAAFKRGTINPHMSLGRSWQH